MYKREVLNSPDNKTIKELQQLGKKKVRKERAAFVIEGIRFVETALEKHIPLKSVFVASSFLTTPKGLALIDKVAALSIRYHEVSDKLFQSIADTVNSQGILAVAPMPMEIALVAQENLPTLSLVLDRIQDPGNLGTIIRTADAAGVHDIILIKGTTDPFSPKVLRSTMGSIFDVRLYFMEADDAIHLMKEKGVRLVVTALGGTMYHYELPVFNPLTLVIGNEGNGVSEAFLQSADERIQIPIYGGAESLNASVAAGIVLYDCAIRQRN